MSSPDPQVASAVRGVLGMPNDRVERLHALIDWLCGMPDPAATVADMLARWRAGELVGPEYDDLFTLTHPTTEGTDQ